MNKVKGFITIKTSNGVQYEMKKNRAIVISFNFKDNSYTVMNGFKSVGTYSTLAQAIDAVNAL